MNGSLDRERKVAAETVERLVTHRAWWWERDAPTGVLHSERECILFAQTSDGLILLIAGELSGIVYSEYEAAKDASAERYIFIREEENRGLPDDVKRFVEQERGTAVTRNFRNEAELESHLYAALIHTAVRAGRERQIERHRGEVSQNGRPRRRQR